MYCSKAYLFFCKNGWDEEWIKTVGVGGSG